MTNIDAIDRRVLHELQSDARRSNVALATAAAVSPSTMLARVRSLEQRGIITGYHADIDLPALGRRVEALVSVRLDPKTPEAVEQFIDSIWEMDATIAVTLLTGPFDIVVHVTASDVSNLGDTVLRRIASAPNVADEQTSIIFDHRRKHVLTPLDERAR